MVLYIYIYIYRKNAGMIDPCVKSQFVSCPMTMDNA